MRQKQQARGVNFTVDMGRIHLVARRIIQCLYFHETKTKLPPETHEARVLSMEILSVIEPERRKRLRVDIVEPLVKEPIHLYAENQFAYWVIHLGESFLRHATEKPDLQVIGEQARCVKALR